jgi:hypothetical protein
MPKNLDSHQDTRRFPCRGRYCYSINQCCREIFDISYEYPEYFLLVETVRKAMLDD